VEFIYFFPAEMMSHYQTHVFQMHGFFKYSKWCGPY